MLQVGLFHVITDKNEIIAVIDATRLRRRKESLQNSGLPGFDPLTSITPLQRSTVWANKPTGSINGLEGP